MAQFIEFFPRQVYAGTQAATGVIYSQVYDVSSAKSFEVELRVYTSNPSASGCSAQIEETNDPTFGTETFSGYAAAVSQSGVGVAPSGYTKVPKRFVRAKLTVAGDTYQTVSFRARAL